MQFGYVTLFSAAFPLAPMLAFLSNYVQIRLDAWKVLTLCRRPDPARAEDIGTWSEILDLISTAAVVTNGVLIFFVGERYIDRSWTTRLFLLFFYEHFLIRYTAESIRVAYFNVIWLLRSQADHLWF